MESESLRKRIRNEVTCSVCLDYFTDPVILDCEHSFCKDCISECWKSRSHTLCPLCKQTVRSKKFTANRALASIAEITKQMNVRKEKPGGRPFCGKHEEPLKLFCKDDKAPVCVLCNMSKEHRDHNVLPVEEASLEYRDQISRLLEMLKKQREKILGYKSTMEKESEGLLKLIEIEKWNTVHMLKELSEFIKKNFQCTKMDQAKKVIVKTRNEHLSRLSQELSSLDSVIQEIEKIEIEKRYQWPDIELLQDIEQTLQKCESEKFENPMAFPFTLKWKIWQFHDKNLSLEKIIKQFKEGVAKSDVLLKAKVILDAQTAHPELIVSKDRKSLTLANKPQCLYTAFLGNWPCALGSQLFNSCTCYWEVAVKNEGGWIVGVSNKSVDLNKKFFPSPENGVWAIGRWKGLYQAVIYPKYPPLTLSEEPRKIRLCLNKRAQLVAFFDADTAALLYTFSLTDSLSDNIYPFFGLQKKTHLQICA